MTEGCGAEGLTGGILNTEARNVKCEFRIQNIEW